VLLLLTGVVASGLRATHVGELGGMLEPMRDAVLGAFGVQEPDAARRAEAVARIDAKFGAHAGATLLHVLAGGLMFVLLPLQFSGTIRSRHPAVHRWNGRVLVAAGSVAGLGGLYFGILHPFAGAVERVIIGLVGTWFLLSITIAVVMIRRGLTARHREWMIRAVAAALSVSTVRMVVLPIDVVMTSIGVGPEAVMLHSFWIGWALTLVGAEWWIRRTRGIA
jgi:hypothetical protein